MTNFLRKIEIALLNDDPFVQRYAEKILRDSNLATPNTLLAVLQSMDTEQKLTPASSILPSLVFMPVDEKVCKLLIERLEKQKDGPHNIWYRTLLKNANTDVLLTYQDRVKPYIKDYLMQSLQEVKSLDDKALLAKMNKIMDTDSSTSYVGKRIMHELFQRGALTPLDVENGIRHNLGNGGYMHPNGLYYVFMAGELRLESVIPELIDILDKEKSDIPLNEATIALIKIGTDAVVEGLEPIALNEENYFYTIDVLAKMKTKAAEQALLRLFDQTEDGTIQTLIADALCQHLSIEAIPKVENRIIDGFDGMMVNLPESLYVNLMLNEINHPVLPELKKYLVAVEYELHEYQSELEKQTLI